MRSTPRLLALSLGLILPLACASPPEPGTPAPSTEEAGADRSRPVRIVTAPSLLANAREMTVELAEPGYLAVFELRPGASLAMVHPYQDALERGEGGRITGMARGAGPLEAGAHNFLRPDRRPEFASLGRTDFNRHSLGPDVLDYPYHCMAGHGNFPARYNGRWLLAVWSPEPLTPQDLWPRRHEACGEVDPWEMAKQVAERITDLPEGVSWTADLVEY